MIDFIQNQQLRTRPLASSAFRNQAVSNHAVVDVTYALWFTARVEDPAFELWNFITLRWLRSSSAFGNFVSERAAFKPVLAWANRPLADCNSVLPRNAPWVSAVAIASVMGVPYRPKYLPQLYNASFKTNELSNCMRRDQSSLLGSDAMALHLTFEWSQER